MDHKIMKMKKCFLYPFLVVSCMLLALAVYCHIKYVTIPCSILLNVKYDKARNVLKSYGVEDIKCDAIYDLTGENEERELYHVAKIKIGEDVYRYPEDAKRNIKCFLGKDTQVTMVLHVKKIDLCGEKGCGRKKCNDAPYCLDHISLEKICMY